MKRCLIGLFVVLLGLSSTFAAQHLIIQSSDSAKEEMFKLEKQWLDKMSEASNGEIVFELVPNGGAVSYDETLDAMRLGVLDGQFTSSGYFVKQEPGLLLLTNVIGAWSDPEEFLKFMYDGGGNQLMQEIYARHGVHFVGAFTSGLESFVSKVPIDSVADLRGLKVRAPFGIIARVFQSAGAIPVELPTNQVKQALQNNVIDAADYTVFATNQSFGLNDIAPNPVYPGFHSVPLLDFSIAEDKWKTLPASLQRRITNSFREFAENTLETFKKLDLEAVKQAKENPNIKIHDWSPAERQKFRALAQKQWKTLADESADGKRAYQLIVTFLEKNNLL